MGKFIKSFVILASSLAALPVWSEDTARIFCYTSTHDDGRGGMRVAWATDEEPSWKILNGNRGVVRSDFGSLKTMFEPRLAYADGIWTAAWYLDKEHTAMALCDSHDMTVWHPQSFLPTESAGSRVPHALMELTPSLEIVEGDTLKGFICTVPLKAIRNHMSVAEDKMRKRSGYGERLTMDPALFSSQVPLNVSIDIDETNVRRVSDKLIGAFFEDINYSADGGLYAELIQNRDFEYSKSDGNKNPEWDSLYAWKIDGGDADYKIMTADPIHENNPHYLSVVTGKESASVSNCGFDGVPLYKDENYDFSMICRNRGKKPVNVDIILRNTDGSISTGECVVPTGKWGKVSCVLKSSAECDSATVELRIPAESMVDLDMVSLFPRNTFMGRPNGLRADLAQAIADIHPKFLRFPGGCLVHGDGIDNIYNWKETVGPLEVRKPAANIWRYHQSRGLGYYEYFQFCEDIGAEPLPVVAAGVSCQNSGIAGPSRHSHDLITSYGQMGGIPMEQMDSYVQDVLDLIEWANGPASSEWGVVRAAAGHPAPFNLKYIGIGNEDLISDVFAQRFKMIYDAVKERYPDIMVIGTSGPFVEGSDYEAGWELARQLGVDMVDEHNYNTPGWFMHNQDFYDSYPKDGPKVYLGEYAVHVPGRYPTVESALATALFLTNVERNSDIVHMTSYAPLLARHGHTQWNPDMIYFDRKNVYTTADYEMQKLFGRNSGDRYLPTSVTLTSIESEDIDGEGNPAIGNDNMARRIGASTLIDSATGDLIIKIVNCLPVELTAAVALPAGRYGEVIKTIFSGTPTERKWQCVEQAATREEVVAPILPPYSITVYRLSPERLAQEYGESETKQK